MKLVAVFAHPDDETFRCGGTLALLARRGVDVHVLCATRGGAGIPDLGPGETGRIREAELRCAARALGIEPPCFLNYRDGTLDQVDEEEAVAQVLTVVQELRPRVLLTWPPDGVSGHPDHVAVSRWMSDVFRRMSEPAALYHIAMPHSLAQRLGMTHLHTVPDEAVTLTVDVAAVWEAKWAAIRCHRSQIGSSPILDAPEEKQRLFLGTEYFRLAAGRLDEAADLFAQAEGHPLALLGSAELALDTGDPKDAEALLQRFLRQMPEENKTLRAPAFELLVRTYVALGDDLQAAMALETLRSITALVRTQLLLASATFAEGIVAVAAADYQTAWIETLLSYRRPPSAACHPSSQRV